MLDKPVWNWRHLALILFALVHMAVQTGASPAMAQETPQAAPPASENVSETDINRAIRLFEDESERKQLLEDLYALRDAQKAVETDEARSLVETALGFIAAQFARFRDQAAALWAQLGVLGQAIFDPNLPAIVSFTMAAFLSLGVGAAALIVINMLTSRARAALARHSENQELSLRLAFLFPRLALNWLAVAGFAFSAFAILSAGWANVPGQSIVATMILGVALFLGLDALARFALAPNLPALRLPPVTDAEAKASHRAFLEVVLILVAGWFAVSTLAVSGASAAAQAGFGNLVALVVCASMIRFIMRGRDRVADLITEQLAGHGWSASLIGFLARSLHVLAITLVVAGFVTWVAAIEDGFGFVLRLGAAVLFSLVLLEIGYVAVDRLVKHVEDKLTPIRRAAFERHASAIGAVAKGVLTILVVAIAVQALGVDLIGGLATETGGRIGGALLSIGLVSLLCLAVWFWAAIVVDARMNEADADPFDRSSVRFRTILPIVQTFLLVTLLVVFVMVALSELGVNTAPLLAGAGVVGLAIGFGSQTLVKDVITGLFILFEDQVQVGDVVDLNGHSGVVEKISIRTVNLRDLSGTVHSLPWNQVGVVKNFTRDFSYYVFDVTVAYQADTDKVTEVLAELGKEMRADEAFRDLLLDDLEVLGLDAFLDSAVLIKARFKTRPGEQWTVGREFNRRLKQRFDERGIEIPYPQRTISFNPPLTVEKMRQSAEAVMGNDEQPRTRRGASRNKTTAAESKTTAAERRQSATAENS